MPEDSQSQPSSPPGQKPTEVPSSLKYDEATMVVWSLFMLLFPPMWVDSDKPIHKRFWAWRYIYTGFAIAIGFVFSQALLSGNLAVLMLTPFAHVIALLSILGLFIGIQIPGAGASFVAYEIAVALYSLFIVLIFTVEVGRRTSPEMFSREPYDCDDDELVIPYDSVTNKADDAPVPPTFDQDVSIAVTGETGSGKTTAMQMLAYQLPYNQETAVIAHDAGEEFQQFYADLGFDVKRVGLDGDVTWNLFQDADSVRDFREIAGAIFGNPDGHNPFHTPAKQVFEDMLQYLHLEAQKNNRREELCHQDIVALLEEGRQGLHDALDSYDQLEAGHIDMDQGKGARQVYQTLIEYTRPVFVDDFAEYGQFSLAEYIQNPDGRVLIIDSTPSRMETLGPMFQLLVDWSIRFAMESPNPTVHILDEIDYLPPLNQVTNLTARGRKEKARAIIGVQTIGQLDDTYSDISGILGNCPQGLYFGPGDSRSTEFIVDEIGERRMLDRTEMQAMSRNTSGKQQRTQSRETYRIEEKGPLTSGRLRDFQPGECITVTRTAWWHGQARQFHEIRADLPEHGAESPGTPQTVAEESDPVESDSWLTLAKQLFVDDEVETGDILADPRADAERQVWPDTEVDETPAITYSERRWEDALARLDIDSPPITKQHNIDAFRDICAMLDRRVCDLAESGDAADEIQQLLHELSATTGLTPSEVLNEVTAQTDLLKMDGDFRKEFVTTAQDPKTDADSTVGGEPAGDEQVDSEPTADIFDTPSTSTRYASGEASSVDTPSAEEDTSQSNEELDQDSNQADEKETEISDRDADTDSDSDGVTEDSEDEFDAADFM